MRPVLMPWICLVCLLTWAACSIYFNVSRTRQDNLPIFIHEATVLLSIPNHSGLH